ncbi:ABC transporter permease [Nocardioides seonyuensis]|uniref:ABC transporter permease n=1 Tax=Nocardioides seonyuensis TaxID=2518371 RepID=A0A4P7IEX9_9ACTN|nr:ABC transporter permease [Nocardioides seonyuensis]QBX54507.1 ABC transporter permease [Nocardioides seonyuensis]
MAALPRPALPRSRHLTSTGIVYGVLVIAIVVGALMTASKGRNFFSVGNIDNILTTTTILGFIAIGQTLVILVGSLDLSVPFVVSLASVTGAGIMADGAGRIVPAVLVTLLLAAVIGLVNGAVVSGLKVHGFIATLGMGLILSGYLASNFQGSFGRAPREFRLLDATRIGPVPIATLLMLAAAVLAILMLRRTRLGHHLYAVGGNADVARMSGIRTAAPVVAAHVLCSVLAAIAGLLLLARLGVGQPTVGSQGSYDLMSIAAVVLGGTLLAGGKGNISGTIAGVAIFAVLDNVMGVMQTDPFLKDVVRGLVIVVAVAVYARRDLDRRPARFGGTVGPAVTAQEAR